MAMMELTARQLRDKIAEGEIRSVEATTAVLKAIERHNPIRRRGTRADHPATP